MTGKRIRDPLYGFIRVDGLDLKIIDHKLVHRLRWISQLPLKQLVYPSTQHSRFEHSLGVMHLAGIAAERLIQNSQDRFDEAVDAHSPSLRNVFSTQAVLRDFFVQCARWSGLLHDLGHAPFSLKEIIVPVFDRKVQRELLVQEDSGQEIPVAEYLGFGVDEDQIQEQGDMFLHVFVKPFSSFSRDDLKNKIADLLKAFEV
ncbi:MAG: HD domain-containing protein [Desulfobacterium sp.]|nr:HD domain-containing protein [Desulfobacterium sp.]